MTVRVAINGMGRIGRNTFRALDEHPDLELVAVNDVMGIESMAHLLQYDSILGRYPRPIVAEEEHLSVDGRRFRATSEPNPARIRWGEVGADVVLECTGRFTDAEQARLHVEGGARKVITSAPGRNDDLTLVLGVNQDRYEPHSHHVISNASCTTNCLAPVVKVLHDEYGIESGIMTTVHAFTGGQRLVDAPHRDLRRARAATLSMIPTSTGATRALARVMPEMEGRFHGLAVRVPVPTVSLVDLTVLLSRAATSEAINEAFRQAEAGSLRGILAVCERPLVSVDFAGDPRSAIVDAASTVVVGGRQAKVLAWYDNEWGYSCRLADVARFVGERL